jgi:hypothetical protein
MRKYLKVRGELVYPDNKFVRMAVLENSHEGLEFGGNDLTLMSHVFSFKRVKLRAIDEAKFKFVKGGYKRPVSVTLGNPIGGSTLIPIEYWKEVKEAVLAYNEWGKSQ